MRNSRSALAFAACGQVLPWPILEFFGSVNWTIATSINPRLGLDIGDVVGERVSVDRPVIDGDLAPRGIKPRQGVFHPVLVVARGEILARMRAAAFGAIDRGIDRYHRLLDQVYE